jgi:hypothetical protein
MHLTKEDINAYIEAWKADFGETITYELAESEAQKLISFFLSLAEARLDGGIEN